MVHFSARNFNSTDVVGVRGTRVDEILGQFSYRAPRCRVSGTDRRLPRDFDREKRGTSARADEWFGAGLPRQRRQ